ncbi:MAG: hypothetical protein IKX88_12925 [Thermoguttaceae bacterium]|nr:hypothetical protein [Thermoguttaceae bacterium]MBR5759489.1 hypothetical protein [Thermoguttaceae bacterium]
MRKIFLLIAALALCVSGCGGGADGHYPVSGSVTFGGSPLAYGRISFQPTGENGASSAAAAVVDGKYSIPANKGLVPGSYSVVFTITEKTGEKKSYKKPTGEEVEYEETVSYVPPEWGEQSTQTVTVEAKKNAFNFEVPRADTPADVFDLPK